MHPSVRAAWHKANEPLEGRVPHMYVDVKGLVTTAVGVLIDPIGLALDLPWQIDGRPATRREIERDWSTLKARASYFGRVHHVQAGRATRCRLAAGALDALVERRLATIERYMVSKYLPSFDSWPADAQLGALSMAWAVGAGMPAVFVRWTQAALAGDWYEARKACTLREDGNPGLAPRNVMNRRCFANAEVVARFGLP